MSRLNHVEAFPLLPKAKEKDLPLIRLTFLVSIQRLPDTSLPDIQSSVTVAFIWHFLLSLNSLQTGFCMDCSHYQLPFRPHRIQCLFLVVTLLIFPAFSSCPENGFGSSKWPRVISLSILQWSALCWCILNLPQRLQCHILSCLYQDVHIWNDCNASQTRAIPFPIIPFFPNVKSTLYHTMQRA